MTIRIAMWSGPRNLSTAMMRSFENRRDCCVSDEPFYAAYLAQTGLDHPMKEEVLASQPTDWREVAKALAGPCPEPASIWYQKHMTHHMLPEFGLEWAHGFRHAFLIRRPERVLNSYVAKRESVTLGDIGFERQAELFETLAQDAGAAPPVIDSDDVMRDPETVLRQLCAALSIEFDPAMLKWPAGRRDSDGVWAPAWYSAVEQSTGFKQKNASETISLTDDLRRIADMARPLYEKLAKFRLSPD